MNRFVSHLDLLLASQRLIHRAACQPMLSGVCCDIPRTVPPPPPSSRAPI
jgi:hypothetical protein